METSVQVSGSGMMLPQAAVSLQAWAERRQAFNAFVNSQLKPGVDFGVIKGCDKPTLLKPGSEKILQFYAVAVTYQITERVHDMQTGHLYIEMLATAVSMATGQIVGHGVGACSTYESKYRYRWETWRGQADPAEGQGWQKTKWGWRRRVENADLADQWNTVIKMAKKRSGVDLALSISGASELFTQDIEDLRAAGLAWEETQQHEPVMVTQPQPPSAPEEVKAEATQAHQTAAPADAGKPGHWFTNQAEKAAFFQWLNTVKLSLPQVLKLAAASMSSNIPLTSPAAFPGDREAFQHAVERQLGAAAATTEQGATDGQ